MVSLLILLSASSHSLGLPTESPSTVPTVPTVPTVAPTLPTEDPSFNLVDVDQKPPKIKKSKVNSKTPLGSQFAVGHIHPERKTLVTGHKIPLGLFPEASQARILDLPIPSSPKYVDTTSFRRPARLVVLPAELPAKPSRILLPPREIPPMDESLSAFGHSSRLVQTEREGDKTY